MDIQRKIDEIKAKQAQAQKQQGLGRPIISEFFQGWRFVAVGSRLFYSQSWKTFHDFLFDYIKEVLGTRWGDRELQKPFNERHPILQWYELAVKYMNSFIKERGVVHSAAMTGATEGYLGLAYNLYLLSHNETIQEALLTRLRKNDKFQGAHYEIIVAAMFIKAGFDIEFENESDPTETHCEFSATHRDTGKKFSVEAKSRAPGKGNVDAGNQLYEALKKDAKFERVIFIDINVPNEFDVSQGLGFFQETIDGLRGREKKLTIKGQPAPASYIFLTNFAYGYHLRKISFERPVVAEGFKIPDFRVDSNFSDLRAALRAEERHREMFDLLEAIRTHNQIPATFDGGIPELEFNKTVPQLKIGEKYEVPTQDGIVVGVLEEAVVLETEKLVYGVYRVEGERRIIATCPLTDDELKAYRRHPDTFFGVYRPTGKKTENPVEIFHEFHNVYKTSSREKLLEFMKGAPNIGALRKLPQSDLAFLYCENLVYSVMKPRASDASSG
ncbi:MAG: hypothetical protein WC047_01345 [Kiritimatiellales bacterium]